MSVKPCKDCGTQVSTKAETCPTCGRQRPAGGVSGAVVVSTLLIGAALIAVVLWAAARSASGL